MIIQGGRHRFSKFISVNLITVDFFLNLELGAICNEFGIDRFLASLVQFIGSGVRKLF